MLLERAALALLIIGLGVGLYFLWNRLALMRQVRRGLKLEEYQPGRPAILYFTSPGCMPCRTIQRPALDELQRRYGDGIQVIEVNALESPELSDHWGVLSVPTTFIIDSGGRPRCINHGAARLGKLERQLERIDELPAPVAKEMSSKEYATTDVSQRR